MNWALLLVFTVGSGGCGSALPTVRRQQCTRNLRTLYDALVQYASLHGDVPRANDGKASLAPLEDPKVQKELGINSSIFRCPADKSPVDSSYLLNPALSVGDLPDLGSDSATIIACDRFANHNVSRNGVRMVLISDGYIVEMDLPPKEQQEWLRLFLSGDKRACTVSREDGSPYWASADVRWYVGEQKGYVPNAFVRN